MILSSLLAAALSAAAPVPTFEARPCAEPVIPRAQCGIVKVPEDRDAPAGRQIELNVMVLKPADPARLPPLFDIDGGPGLPVTKNAGFNASLPVARGRDIVMVDQRGTGGSNPLLCPELQTGPTEAMLPRDAVERCRSTLSKKADLRFYGTRDAVSDLEDVRRALGYWQIDLFGLSYGTTVALRYMQRFPNNVRAAALMGTAPPDFAPPRHHATSANDAWKLVVADCAATAECRTAYPDLLGLLERARARAGEGPSPVGEELLMERFRALMYTATSRSRMPLMIRQAAEGDRARLFDKPAETGASMIADGMFLAVTCGESFPLFDYESAIAAAKRTPFGDYRLRRQKAACEGWPEVKRDRNHVSLPSNSTAAVLLISGEMDPVTPAAYAEAVKAKLRKARHIVLPKSGHIPDGLSGLDTCFDPLLTNFFDHGELDRLDTTCISAMKGPAYAVR